MNEQINKEVQFLKGVGPHRASLLEKLGIKTAMDLIYYAPRDWVDRSEIRKIASVIPGEPATVKGVVIGAGTKKIRYRLSVTTVVIKDESGFITGVWYNQPYIEKNLKRGGTVIFHGKVEMFRNNFQIPNPEYEAVSQEDEAINVNRIVPIYSLTGNLNQKQFRKITKHALDSCLEYITEFMPPAVAEKHGLIGLKEALFNIHFPENMKMLNAARKRLVFDEFYVLRLAFALKKKRQKEKQGIVFDVNGECKVRLRDRIPFKLTGAQKKVIKRIKEDLVSGKPMNRLLQGDVGSGKTVVALVSCVIAKDSGCQSVIMAPTEILANQHFAGISELIRDTGVRAEILLGGTRKKQRMNILERLKNNEIDILIGTHAVLQDDVVFADLGLAVIDEQHKFGVRQRAKLISKAQKEPHILIMTATPIPRTLSMTVYGDTDISVIDELPPGRKPVKTVVFNSRQKNDLYFFVEQRLRQGDRVYAVYPLVEDSEKIDLKSAMEMAKEWSARFSGYNVELLHGRMKKDEKEKVMESFKNGKTHILVSTTVIEVGVDVPEASVMVIEHAERFGLSQLHQLRGRVGRGGRQSYCILVGRAGTEDGIKRLKIMAATNDGFKISEEDLKIRGPGEFMGVRQHGLPEFRIADIMRDRDIMEQADKAAFETVREECELSHIQKAILNDNINNRYKERFDLINTG
ncbi:MAG: ATP-dependent DNA helicase RecG [bacterium]